ncbi:phage tail tape measure protein [Rhodovulum sulfidophilum]|nr:hypothetical protein [Rhodovulum sulfidophilum]MCE8455439.1 hypothetical protein [Rhodovulum sulfidophilum]
MIDVGRLRVRLGLDNREFQTGLAKARGAFGKFAGRIAAAAAPVAIGAAVAAAARSSFEMVDAQAKLAQSLETSTRSVQLLGRAADLSGVPMSQLQQAALALNKRLSEASSGAGPAVKALRALGLEARDLLGLDLDQRFDRINGAIAGLEDPAKKAAVAAALYGDRAYAAITRLDSATLSQAARDVDQFGVALSELQADNIEAANDAMSTLGVVMRGVGNQVAASMAPAITALATGFTDLLREGTPLRAMLDGLGASVSGTFQVMSGTIGRLMSYAGTFASFLAGRFVTSMSLAAASVVTLNAKLLLTRAALMRTGFGALVIGVGELIYRFTGLVEATGGVGQAFDALKTVAIEVWERIGAGTRIVVLAVKRMGWAIRADFYGTLEAIQSKWGGVITNMAAIGAIIPGFGSQFRAVAAEIRKSSAAAKDLKTATSEATGKVAENARAIEAALTGFTAPLASVEALRAKLREARAEMDNTGTSSQGLKAALKDLNDALSGDGKGGKGSGVDEVESGLTRLGTSVNATSSSFQSFFKDIVKGSGDAGDAISALADRMLDDLLDRAMSPLSDALGSMFDGLFSGLFGGRASGGGGTVKPIGDLIGKVMDGGSFDGGGRTPIGPRAGGLDGKGGFLAMLHPNESVIDHTRDSGGFGGFGAVRGGDVYVSVQGSNASPEQIAAAVRAESRRQASEIYDRRKRMARAGGAS